MIAHKLSEEHLAAFESTQEATSPGNQDGEEKKKPTQAQILLGIAQESMILFKDQHQDPFCFIENKTYPLKSSRVKDILSYQFFKQTGKAPNADALTQTMNTLRGKALFESPTITLQNRVAEQAGAFWYHMGDGKVIKVTPDKWEITEKVPILFRSYSTQEAQVPPQQDGNIWDVFDFLNIDQKHQLLVAVYLISCFLPEIPHPIFHPHGAQGSGKTTFCRVLKSLIDPSPLSTLIMQRDYAQLIQVIAHHHFVPFDNLSDLPGWASDVLAIACTGGGLSKRQLYTDEEDVVLSVKRCIGINAINLLIQRADLMDRSILLHLERIDPNRRKDETEFWADFEKKKAGILGGIFNTLSRAIAIYPTVKLKSLPRMADFAKWGYAIGEALKQDGGNEFLEAYDANIAHQNEEIIQSNTLIIAVLSAMDDRIKWEGTIKTIYDQLLENTKPDKKDHSFPKTERKLRAHLERAKTTLAQQGIHFSIGERTGQGYPLSFWRTDLPEDRKFGSFATSTTPNVQKKASETETCASNEANVANSPTPGVHNEVLDFTGKVLGVLP